jgi:hypothetical protein
MLFLFFFFVFFRETHVWFVLPDEFKSVSLLNQYMELLSPCEKENVLSMRGDQLQKRALLARTLVRTTIARCKFLLAIPVLVNFYIFDQYPFLCCFKVLIFH